MSSTRDVVITGLGIVSPIGIGREAFRDSLQQRRSGVALVEQYDCSALDVKIGAELKDFQPKLYIKPRKSLKVMSHEIQMGVASSTLAVEDAQLDVAAVDHERFGVVYGSPMLYTNNEELADQYRACMVDGEFDFDKFGESFSKNMLPLWLLKYLPNMTASHIGIAQQARGPNNSVVQGDLSSSLAIMEAASVIRRGWADIMLSGGAGSRLDITAVAYRGDSNLSHRNDDPEGASRPFDAARDGMVNGEAAVTVVLESRAHAVARGASIMAELVACSSTHRGQPSDGAMQRAIANSIRGCLRSGNVTANDIDHVNAHGTSEVEHDAIESGAIHETLRDVCVTAPKSYFGNVGAAAGAIELAASLECDGIPATLNYTTPDKTCQVNVSKAQAPSKSPWFLNLNQSGTGHAAAMLLRKLER